MPINLLGNFNNPFQNQQTGGKSTYNPQQAGTVGMSTPQGTRYVPIQQPMGITAKNPSSSTPTPPTTLPKTQQNPVQPPVQTPLQNPPPDVPQQLPHSVSASNQTYVGADGQTYYQGGGKAPTPTTFPGLLGAAAGQANALNTTAGSISNTAQQIGQQGQMTPDEVAARVALLRLPGQANQANILALQSTPEALLQQGREAQAQQLALAKQQELSGTVDALAAERAAATGALTGQAGAQSQAGGLQTSAGGLLNTAAGLAQPNLGSIGQVPYSPLDLSQGSPLGAPGGTAADAAKVAGSFQGAQAAAAAPGQAQASNIQTAGTTGVNTAAAGYAATAQNYNQMYALNSTADLQARQVQNVLQQTGLNNVSSTDYNTAINKLSGRLGSANVTALNTSLQELRTAYTNLLSSAGMTPTGSEAQSLDVLNSGSTPAQITQAIYQLQTAANNRLVPQYELLQKYQAAGGIGGGSTGNTTASGAQGWL